PASIAYSLEGNLPSGATINPGTGLVTWTPTEAQGPGTYVFIVRATENNAAQLSSARNFGVTVNELNQAPSLTALNNFTVEEGATVGFTAAAADADLPSQKFSYSLL